MLFRSVEFNLVDRFLIYGMAHRLSFAKHDIRIFLVLTLFDMGFFEPSVMAGGGGMSLPS